MPVETTFNYLSDLNASYPTAGDSRSEGDDHIRGIKNVLKTTFPNVNAAITASDEELSQASTIATRGPILITSGTPSGASTVTISSGSLGSTYEVHEWHVVSFVPSAAATLNLRINGVTIAGLYDWIRTSSTVTTTTTANSGASATEIALTASNTDTTAGSGFWTGWIRVYDAASATATTRVEWQLSYTTSSSAGTMVTVRGCGSYRILAATTSLEIYPSSGTVTGKHKFYGWLKS